MSQELLPLKKGDTGSVPEDMRTRTSQAVDLLQLQTRNSPELMAAGGYWELLHETPFGLYFDPEKNEKT